MRPLRASWIAALFWLAPVFAQDAMAQSRALGVKGGITLASANIEDLQGTFDADNRTGWGIGAFLTLGGGFLSVQPELNLLELGFDVTLAPGVSREVKLRYFAPAVVLRLGIPLGLVRPGVFVGGGIGIELDCRVDDIACEDTPFSLETGATDPAAVIGADVDIGVGRSLALRGDVRYAIGLSDIHKASDLWTEIRNRAWQVQAGLAYRF